MSLRSSTRHPDAGRRAEPLEDAGECRVDVVLGADAAPVGILGLDHESRSRRDPDLRRLVRVDRDAAVRRVRRRCRHNGQEEPGGEPQCAVLTRRSAINRSRQESQ